MLMCVTDWKLIDEIQVMIRVDVALDVASFWVPLSCPVSSLLGRAAQRPSHATVAFNGAWQPLIRGRQMRARLLTETHK